jgi:hypothetical protein
MKPLSFSIIVLAAAVCLGLGLQRTVPADTTPRFAEIAFDSSGGLGSGWRDLGWAPRELIAGKPAKLDLADRSGWIVARKGLTGTFGALFLRYQAPAEFGDFLELRLDSNSPGEFPRITVTQELRRTVNGWTEVLIPISALDPRGLPFEKIVLRARLDVPHTPVYLDRIALTERGPGDGSDVRVAPAASTGRAREGRFTVQCRAPVRPINPMIYGVGGVESDGSHWTMGIGAKRWGGNPSSRYNWQLGHAWNAGADYFFRNVDYSNDPTFSYDRELQQMLAHGVPVALTVPTIGWVAKDTTSYSFPVSVFGPQEKVAGENPDMGNGKTKDGQAIPPGMPPTRTSVAASPEFIGKWLATIREKDQKRGRSVRMVILDNEPALWHSTHRDVHPNPISYNELLERTLAYGTAVRRAYPEVMIAGPAEWGWTGYFYSGLDAAAGISRAPDRRAHGNVPLVPWWLHSVRAHEKKAKIKLLDVLDVHYYPQGANLGVDRGGATDRLTAALRIRSTRSLWDPTYVDESWIDDRIELIPRLRRWVNENAPGVGISLGEYSFGAAEHQSGGLAQAEALGRFGTEGLTAAFYWYLPPKDSPAYWAFRAYRNFDGKGGRFLDLSVPVVSPASLASLFVSRSEGGDHLVAVLLNLDPDEALAAEIDLGACAPAYRERAFVYTGGKGGFTPAPASQSSAGVLRRTVPPYSMTVLDLTAMAGH